MRGKPDSVEVAVRARAGVPPAPRGLNWLLEAPPTLTSHPRLLRWCASKPVMGKVDFVVVPVVLYCLLTYAL